MIVVDGLYPIVDFFCIIILAFLGYQNENYSNIGRKQIYFRFIILSSVVFSCFDAFWGMLASKTDFYPALFIMLNSVRSICATWSAVSWVRYVICNASYDTKIKNKHLFYGLLLIPFYFVIIFLCLNLKFLWLTEIQDGRYVPEKNILIFLIFLVQLFYFLLSFVISLVLALKKEKNVRLGILFFSGIPLLSCVSQIFSPRYPCYSIGFMLSCFSIFLFDVIVERELAAGKTLELKQKQILDKCSDILTANGTVQKNIDTLLSLLCNYYDSDRVFLMCFDSNEPSVMNCEYEYCSPGIEGKIENYKHITKEKYEFWLNRFNFQDTYYIQNVFDYSYNNGELSETFRKYNVMSAIIAPLRSSGKLYGTIGFDNPRVNTDDFSIVRTVSIYVNSELLRKKQIEYEQKTSGAVLLTLAQEYSSVYYVDLATGILKPYRLDSQINKMYGHYFDEGITYRALFEMHLSDLVFEEDREELKPFADIEYLRKKLKTRASIRRQYRSTNRIEYFQAKWVRIGKDKENPEAVVLGFANITEQVHNKELLIEQKKVIEERQNELVSAIEKAEDAKRISQLDRLTGLFNKISGQNLITDYLITKHSSELYSLIFIDIDKFKDFNDIYGHLVGDDILELVGEAIKRNCRQNDIAIRFGGDEFVILLKKVQNSEAAERKAKRIQEELIEISAGKEYSLTCSIGIVTSDSSNFDEAVQKADEALYDVKESGRNNIKLA